jgi:hypothetical protein
MLNISYRVYKNSLDLRNQIELLKATVDHFSEKADSEISDEVDQGLISLVDKSTIIHFQPPRCCTTSLGLGVNKVINISSICCRYRIRQFRIGKVRVNLPIRVPVGREFLQFGILSKFAVNVEEKWRFTCGH